MRKVGEYYYEKKGLNWVVYVVEKIAPMSTTMPGFSSGAIIHSRKVETHFTPEAARRRVYELNGWSNYKPLEPCLRTASK